RGAPPASHRPLRPGPPVGRGQRKPRGRERGAVPMKRLLLENLATKGMAVLLAVLTWVYLFAQGNAKAENVEVEFEPFPALDPQIFASVVFKDSQGRESKPGSTFRVHLSGTRSDVRT